MISIFTPTHNAKYIQEVYTSLQNQTLNNWEWVILRNNGCGPITIDDPRVKIYEGINLPPWTGALKAEACRLAQGDILLELDHDDLLLPTALEETHKAFLDPTIGFVYSNSIFADKDLNKVQKFDDRCGWKYRDIMFDGKLLDECIAFPPRPEAVSKIWFAPNHLRAFRRNIYEQIGGYNNTMHVLDDQDLMSRLFQITRFHHIDKGLYVYRIHGENTWIRFNKDIQDNVLKMYDYYIESMVEKDCADRNLRKIDLGGRFASKTGYETVDLKNADIIADLNGPWPFEDNSIGIIRAYDIFEHLTSPLHTMKEVYRVLAPGGFLFCQVPSTDGRGAFQDPTHVSFWNINSFKYYTEQRFAQYIDTPVRFQAVRLYDTGRNEDSNIWTRAHLLSLKNDYRTCDFIWI